MKFSHTLTTTATPEQIWAVWIAVDRWHEWDTELESASLAGAFALNAQGTLKPKSAPASAFNISQLDPGISYTFTTQLPFCKLHVHRFLTSSTFGVSFTHEVSFTGLLAPVFGLLLGQQFRAVLPSVMENLRQQAESSSS